MLCNANSTTKAFLQRFIERIWTSQCEFPAKLGLFECIGAKSATHRPRCSLRARVDDGNSASAKRRASHQRTWTHFQNSTWGASCVQRRGERQGTRGIPLLWPRKVSFVIAVGRNVQGSDKRWAPGCQGRQKIHQTWGPPFSGLCTTRLRPVLRQSCQMDHGIRITAKSYR